VEKRVVAMNIFGFLLGALFGIFMNVPPVQAEISQFTWGLNPNRIPEPDVLVRMRIRNIIDDKLYQELMQKHGYASAFAMQMRDAAKSWLGASSLITLFRRGEISEEYYLKNMEELGYPECKARQLLKATEYFPPPPDLVRFAVREVYTPEIVEEYGLDQDLPEKFLEEAKKAGLPEEQARNYWRAKWELPSVQQGYEMYFREQITKDELMTLLRVKDIMPKWREPLLNIAHQVITRVDARRLLADGVITPEEHARILMHQGYTEEDAWKVTEWAERYYLSEKLAPERDLTKSEIVKGVKNELITPEQGVELLMDMGYDEWEAWYVLIINVEALRGSPETYPEFKRITEAYKKARKRKGKEIPAELIEAARTVRRIEQDIAEKKEQGKTDEELSEEYRLLSDAKYRYRQLLTASGLKGA